MKKAPNKANRSAIWKSLTIFLEGNASLNWLIDEIKYSGFRGGDLARILQNLAGHGDPDLYDAILSICHRKGWLGNPEDAPPYSAAVSPPLALIIEDNDDSATIFANAMLEAGFAIEVIRSGEAALVRLNETSPAVVILDLHLPHISGAEILRHIRTDIRLAKVYVVVSTAYPDMARGLGETADQMFLKPVSYIQLRNLVLQLGLKYTGRTQTLQ
jgi:CheY-like chemotaxis protein